MLYTGLKHLHVLLVVLFVISILVKAILLFVNQEKFEVFRNKTKVPEMIISTLFLVTGIWMLIMKSAHVHSLFWVKITMVLAGIPLGIIGFKKKAKIPAMLAAFLFIMAYGVSEMAAKKAVVSSVEVDTESRGTVTHGQALYTKNCVTCHGEDGKKELAGATNLSTSVLNLDQSKEVIMKGRKSMPAFNALSADEIEALAAFVQTLKVQ